MEKTIDLDATNSIDESEIIALASVDYESASRLAFDRSQRRNISLTRKDKPKDTDHRFMTALIPLLRKVILLVSEHYQYSILIMQVIIHHLASICCINSHESFDPESVEQKYIIVCKLVMHSRSAQ